MPPISRSSIENCRGEAPAIFPYYEAYGCPLWMPRGCPQVMVANRNYMKSQTTPYSYQVFIAQLVKQLISNQKAVGSSPTSGKTITKKVNNLFIN